MVGLCALALAAGPLLDVRLHQESANAAPLSQLSLSGCVPADDAVVPSWPAIKNADSRLQSTFRCAGTVLSVDVARFQVQHPGKEAISAANKIVDTRLVSAARPSVIRISEQVSVHSYRVDRGAEPALLWSWYAIGRTPAAGATHAKMLEAGRAALFRRPSTAIFTITAWAPAGEASEELLAGVAQQVWDWYLQQE